MMATDRVRRANTIRDAIAGVLVLLGLLLPWNVYFGVGIAGSTGWVFAVLAVVTVASMGSLAVSRFGARDPETLAQLRFLLNVPYFLLVLAFVVFTVIQAFRSGGTVEVAPGIGPGAWLGAAGAVLAAQPLITFGASETDAASVALSRIIGAVAIALGVVAVVSNMYWRTRFVAPNIGDSETSTQNIVVLIAAILYGAVALAPVVVVGRWLMSPSAPARFATLLVGAASLIAGVFVWVLPIGRELDAFHGIAQNTSTAGVGFEGYLAWAVAAAIVGTSVVVAALTTGLGDVAREAVRKCLLLIAIWCGGAALLRILDVMSASALDLPAPAYNGVTMMVFDLLAALLAMWIFVNGNTEGAAGKPVTRLLFGVLSAVVVARVIIDYALVPRYAPLTGTEINAVYGNTLSQQITSTFDITLCIVALGLLSITLVMASGRATASPAQAIDEFVEHAAPTTVIAPPVDVANLPDDDARFAPTTAIDTPTAPPAIVRTDPAAGVSDAESAPANPEADKIAEALAQSTQRFAAGTTYGGSDRTKG